MDCKIDTDNDTNHELVCVCLGDHLDTGSDWTVTIERNEDGVVHITVDDLKGEGGEYRCILGQDGFTHQL